MPGRRKLKKKNTGVGALIPDKVHFIPKFTRKSKKVAAC